MPKKVKAKRGKREKNSFLISVMRGFSKVFGNK